MSNRELKHLFTPGDGGVPPYLAGRKKEQEYFQDCVEALRDKKPVSRNLILYGPRGNGKTALLGYLQKETLQKEAPKLDILWETPDEMGNLKELSDRLLDGHQKLRGRVRSAEVSGGVGFARAKTEIDLSRTPATIRQLLRERSQSKPFILIIDEAHRLKPGIAESLLNASQTVRMAGNPFLLVLAGTPNLRAALGKASASFWDRSKIFPLGRLSPEEARQAVTVPLEKAGISFAPGVVEEIVEHTHCYPYFTQVWGDCLARRLDQAGETEITLDTVREAEATAISQRDAMYQIRFNEIKEMRLLAVAGSVADAFIQSGEQVLHGSALDEAIEKGMADDKPITNERIMEKVKQLSHLGYVWQVAGDGYEPGIPSLMTYIQGYSLPGKPVPSIPASC